MMAYKPMTQEERDAALQIKNYNKYSHMTSEEAV